LPAQTRDAETDFALASPGSFSFDRRDQFFGLGYQRVRLRVRFASCLHSAAHQAKLRLTGHRRALPESSFIPTPTLRQAPFRNYCPKASIPMATWARPVGRYLHRARFQQSQAGIRRRLKRAITPISGFTKGTRRRAEFFVRPRAASIRVNGFGHQSA
jgi:hypothetical protein